MPDGRLLLGQRCANHELREAVSRCPQCRRSLCRECVTDHEGRLVCAACLRISARDAAAPRPSGHRVKEIGMTVAAVFLAWAIFFGAAQSLITITERSERAAWPDR
jgi:hypothetical protein